MSPPSFQFTKFVAGDYTGNLSEGEAEELMKVFQIKDCWRSLHSLSADVGFGVPSVREILSEIVRNSSPERSRSGIQSSGQRCDRFAS